VESAADIHDTRGAACRNWLLAVPAIFTVSGMTVTPRRVDRAKDVSAAKWLQASCKAPGYEGPERPSACEEGDSSSEGKAQIKTSGGRDRKFR
jgi:hypothetical protein